MISILTWKNSDNKTANINVKNCRFKASVTMTLNVENGKNSFTVFSHAKISCHHYTMSEDDMSDMTVSNDAMKF